MAQHESKHEKYSKKEVHAELYMAKAVTSQPWTPSQKNSTHSHVFQQNGKHSKLKSIW